MFLARNPAAVRVRIVRVRGSSPRDAGAEMVVAEEGIRGTVGGGQLEFIAVARARAMLRDGHLDDTLDVPLGPEIGQCCGGRIELALTRLRRQDREAMLARLREQEAHLPQVLLVGAGHVGRALATLLQHMPVRTVVVDPRRVELDLCTADVETRASAIPEADIAAAAPASAFVVATHDHGLDFLATSAALRRRDAAYVGLIGSRTKRERFVRWCRTHCNGLCAEELVCPIGAGGAPDKRPSVIAAMVTAELMTALAHAFPANDTATNGSESGAAVRGAE